jgi:putative transposase
VKRDFWAVFDAIEADGTAAEAEARRRAARFIATYKPLYPAAAASAENNLDQLVAYLRFPRQHWKRIRHSNLIERTFGETRRRVKVIGRLPGEQSCLSLVWAVLDRASKGCRGLTMTPAALRRLQDLRREILGLPRHADPEPAPRNVPAAAYHHAQIAACVRSRLHRS